MRSGSHSGFEGGRADRPQTDFKKRDAGDCQKILFIVGIGPGHPDHLTRRAAEVLSAVDAVAGYTRYIDLIRPLVHGKRIISTPMKKEVDRVQAAIEIARRGESCAIVSSGDPGIYAMAGLVFEFCSENGIPIRPLSGPFSKDPLRNDPGGNDPEEGLGIEIVPGVPALCAGASLLGAPLMHDFAVVSLSDLLTPWPVIERRLEAAAEADFVIVLYNPKSKRRGHQLAKAHEILMRHRDARTPVGVVTRAMRDGQSVRIVPLEDLPATPADMETTIFVGSRASAAYRDFMFTPRGYSDKYSLQQGTAGAENKGVEHP